MEPRISVIIPVYNKAQFLRRCLDSCVNQRGAVAEFIVVDDCSTDNSAEICEEYARNYPNIHFYRKRQNGGVSMARNFGINNATCPWITFLDADDEYPLSAIKNMQTYARGLITSFNHYRQFGDKPPKMTRYVGSGCYGLDNRQTCWWGVWNKVYQTEFIRRYGIHFDKKVSFGEDELFNLECLAIAGNYQHFAVSTLIRHFDDKQSLVHTLGPEGVLGQHAGLKRLKNRWKREGVDKQTIKIIDEVMKEHVESALYLRILDGKTPEEYVAAK